MLKTIYYKSSLIAYFVQTFTMACIHYVVMIHLSELVILIELETGQVKSMSKTFTSNSQKSWTTYLFERNNEIF